MCVLTISVFLRPAAEQRHSPGLRLPPGYALLRPLGVRGQVVDQLAADLVGGLDRVSFLRHKSESHDGWQIWFVLQREYAANVIEVMKQPDVVFVFLVAQQKRLNKSLMEAEIMSLSFFLQLSDALILIWSQSLCIVLWIQQLQTFPPQKHSFISLLPPSSLHVSPPPFLSFSALSSSSVKDFKWVVLSRANLINGTTRQQERGNVASEGKKARQGQFTLRRLTIRAVASFSRATNKHAPQFQFCCFSRLDEWAPCYAGTYWLAMRKYS